MIIFLILFFLCNDVLSFEIKIFNEKNLKNCLKISQFAVLKKDEKFLLASDDCHCVYIYDKDFNLIRQFGRLSNLDKGFENFWAIASKDEHIYISGHIKNISIFDKNGNYIRYIDTGKSTIRKIIPVDDYLLLGSARFPQIKIYKNEKIIREFGLVLEENKNYPTGAFVPLAAEKGKIYFSTVLNYPVIIYDFEGNIIGKFGDPKLIKKPYYEISEKDFRKISAIIDLILYKDYLISIQIMPKGSRNPYSWDVFNKDSGDLILQGYETDFYILDIYSNFLILEKYNEPCKIFFAEIIMDKKDENK